MTGIVLSLCDRTGVMVQPWLEAGYDCITVDLQADNNAASDRWARIRCDVREYSPPPDLAAVFAFPPCTHLAVSGARWWKDKGLRPLIEGLEVVEACRRICADSGAPWMLENPVGWLSQRWREPDHYFSPNDFAGWADDPDSEAYTKKTCLWTGAGFVFPYKRWVDPVMGSLFHHTPPGPDRGDVRSVTPQGFARAVFAANSPAEVAA